MGFSFFFFFWVFTFVFVAGILVFVVFSFFGGGLLALTARRCFIYLLTLSNRRDLKYL